MTWSSRYIPDSYDDDTLLLRLLVSQCNIVCGQCENNNEWPSYMGATLVDVVEYLYLYHWTMRVLYTPRGFWYGVGNPSNFKMPEVPIG